MDTSTETTVTARVVIDMDRCIECRSCAAACHYAHHGATGVGFARGGWALLPLICRQCKAAACVAACPAEAMIRDEQGVVRRKLCRCIGCGSCVRACPFGVLSNDLTGVPSAYGSPDRISGHQVGKCDLCADRTEAGHGAEPRCVAACPAGALVYLEAGRDQQTPHEVLGGRTTGDNPYKRR